MKLLLKFVFVLLIIATIAFFTKPADSACKEEASKKLQTHLISKVKPEFAMGESLIKLAVKNGVSIEDKFFYKEINFSFRGETKTVGYGFFGFVNMKKLDYYSN